MYGVQCGNGVCCLSWMFLVASPAASRGGALYWELEQGAHRLSRYMLSCGIMRVWELICLLNSVAYNHFPNICILWC